MEKKNNMSILILLFVACAMIIAIFGGFYLYKAVVKNDNKGNNGNVSTDINKDNLKKDVNKEYVFDAEYDIKTIKDSYKLSNDTTKVISSKNIKVPYININSEDVSEINDKLYSLQQEMVKIFNENVDTGMHYYTAIYNQYINNNILSLVVITEVGGSDIPKLGYYIYNIDLSTGKKLTFNQIVNKNNLNITNVNNTIKSKIEKIVKENPANTDSCTFNFRDSKNQTPLEAAIDEYNDNLTNDNVIGYIDANGDLHAIVTIYFCAGRGQELQDIVIK